MCVLFLLSFVFVKLPVFVLSPKFLFYFFLLLALCAIKQRDFIVSQKIYVSLQMQ